jgi:cytochrome P450
VWTGCALAWHRFTAWRRRRAALAPAFHPSDLALSLEKEDLS